ncbi:signal peptidase II [Fusobacterium varium]|jgi:signal peptidase II|uniref:signal peptidase II n=1 Tax=uncultured Fusobacterium sp. TaxID=159267 RepID=UPI0015A72F37|nr:signal peptidase II [uncultured Fusobacterium sp.]MCF2639346.1 signal peptidase II [Fusobacterium varium]
MVYIILVAILIALDQVSKYIIDNNFFEGDTLGVITDFFHITYVKNRGIAFGMFQGKLDIISIATVIAIIAIIYYLYKDRNKMPILEKIGFNFILAGAIGNMIDRVARGFVIDMIDFRGIWAFVFNLADVWINIGVLLILLEYFFDNKKKKI